MNPDSRARSDQRPDAGDAGAQGIGVAGRHAPAPLDPGEGQYGQVLMSPDGTRAVKEVLDGRQFGRYEVELACKMGELGRSLGWFSAADAIEMEVAPGKPLWSQYKRGEEDPVMTTAQAARSLPHMTASSGFAHGDLHPLQLICDGDDVKMVDFWPERAPRGLFSGEGHTGLEQNRCARPAGTTRNFSRFVCPVGDEISTPV